MRLALGVLFLWLGCALLYVATHGIQAATPWEAYQTVLGAIRDGVSGSATTATQDEPPPVVTV